MPATTNHESSWDGLIARVRFGNGLMDMANGGDKWEYWFEATKLTAGTPTVRVAVPDNRYR